MAGSAAHLAPEGAHSGDPLGTRRAPYLFAAIGSGAEGRMRVTVTATPGRGQRWSRSWLGSSTSHERPSAPATKTLWPPVE